MTAPPEPLVRGPRLIARSAQILFQILKAPVHLFSRRPARHLLADEGQRLADRQFLERRRFALELRHPIIGAPVIAMVGTVLFGDDGTELQVPPEDGLS
jgi:hypothetical protein